MHVSDCLLAYLSFRPAISEEIRLRHVETDVLIPKMMREKAKERCAEKVEGVCMCVSLCQCQCLCRAVSSFLRLSANS